MADKREKDRAILLRFGSKTRIFELFDSTQWPAQPEADKGLYRVRVCEYVGDRKRSRWLCIGGQKYSFFTLEALMQHLLKELDAPGWLEALQRPAPKLHAKDWVRWHASDYDTRMLHLASDPFLWVDGQWRVLIRDLQLGQRMLCCDELTLVDRFGREVAR